MLELPQPGAGELPNFQKAAAAVGLPCLARANHQHSKHLHRFEPGVLVGPGVDKDTIHHKELARVRRVFDNVQCLIKERVQALAGAIEQLREEIAGARRVRFLLAHERDTPSCLATAAILTPAGATWRDRLVFRDCGTAELRISSVRCVDPQQERAGGPGAV